MVTTGNSLDIKWYASKWIDRIFLLLSFNIPHFLFSHRDRTNLPESLKPGESGENVYISLFCLEIYGINEHHQPWYITLWHSQLQLTQTFLFWVIYTQKSMLVIINNIVTNQNEENAFGKLMEYLIESVMGFSWF